MKKNLHSPNSPEQGDMFQRARRVYLHTYIYCIYIQYIYVYMYIYMCIHIVQDA